MKSTGLALCVLITSVAGGRASAQGTPPAAPPQPPLNISVPTFTTNAMVGGTNYRYTLVGGDPAKGGTTTIPTVLVPITLTIDAPVDAEGRKAVARCRRDCATGHPLPHLHGVPLRVGHHPVCRRPHARRFLQGRRQRRLAHAARRAQGGAGEDHRADRPGLRADVEEDRPHAALVDLRFMQRELFKQLPKDAATPGSLVLAVAPRHHVLRQRGRDARLPMGHLRRRLLGQSAAVFCARDLPGSGTSWTLTPTCSPSPSNSPSSSATRCMTPCMAAGAGRAPGNVFPAWMKVPAKTADEQPRQNSGAGGTGLTNLGNDPTDVNWKNTVPASKAFVATVGDVSYHLQNVALLQWYNRTAAPNVMARRVQLP